jgi:putative ABC transport system permease protein
MLRWALRLLRREWRQQALILGLLAASVMAAVGFASAAYNTVGVSEDATFGSARHRYTAGAPVPDALPAVVADAEDQLGVVDVVARWNRPIPGSVDTVEYRAQDPAGAFSAPMLALREGRYPSVADEVAVTDGVAGTFGLRIGTTFGADGRDRMVVGLVENPSDLGDEFALTSPTDREQAQTVTILVGATESDERLRLHGLGESVEIDSRDVVDDRALAAVGVLGIVTVALVLVSLVAAAGFVVVAQRRARQLGMLGAIGASETNLRLVVVANGAVVGLVAALLGAVAGIGAWVVAVPRMEDAVGHRIDAWGVPWWVIAAATTLVVLAATAAAWWPARAVARMPITRALSGRPPTPQSVHRSAGPAGVLVAVGVVSLAVADGSNGFLIMVGTVTTVAGVLLVSPLAVRGVGRAVGRLPIAMRLALRDMARHQARSGIALAAISLTLGIPVAIVVVSSAAESTTELGNLSDRQLLVWTRDPSQPEGVSPYYTEDPDDEGFSPYLPRLTEAELDGMADEVDRLAAGLDEATAAGLELVTDPTIETTADGRLAVTLGRPMDNGIVDVAPLFVATPELLDLYDIDISVLGPDTEVLSLPVDQLDARLPSEARRMLVSNEVVFSNTSARQQPEVVRAAEPLVAGYTSVPGSLITPEAARQRGWQPVRVGWLVESASPITTEQRLAARELAVDAGLLVEARRDPQPSLVTLRWAATATGMVVALAVLAMTVGLIRHETAGEVRTLTAAGATAGIRRTLSAATAGSLALLGAILGTAGAYVALIAGYLGDIGALTPVPILHLFAITAGIPGAAGLAGWLLAGREPPALTRQAIE